MAVSGKTEKLEWPYFVDGDKPPHMGTVTKAQADRAEALLTGAAGQLLVVQDTGAPAAKAMKGDATLAKDGTVTVGAERITLAKLEKAAKPVTLYASSIIVTEQNTASAAYVELGTPDKIEGIVVPTGGKLIVNFAARMKSTVGEGGKVAIFIGANQLTNPGGSAGAVVEVHNVGGEWNKITTTAGGMGVFGSGATGTDVATGMMIGPQSLEIYIPAGTYTVSVKAKNEGGGITYMRERKLYVEVHGF